MDTFILGMTARIFRAGKVLTHIFSFIRRPTYFRFACLRVRQAKHVGIMIVMLDTLLLKSCPSCGLNVSTKLRELSLSWRTAMLNTFTGFYPEGGQRNCGVAINAINRTTHPDLGANLSLDCC